jgi:hypothetical protein
LRKIPEECRSQLLPFEKGLYSMELFRRDGILITNEIDESNLKSKQGKPYT